MIDWWWTAILLAQQSPRWGALHYGEIPALVRYLSGGGDAASALTHLNAQTILTAETP